MSNDHALPELDPQTQQVVDWLGLDHPVAQKLIMQENPMIAEVLLAVLEVFAIELDYLRSEVERLEALIPLEEESTDDEGNL